MAAAEIVGAAIGVLLLVVVAYMLVAGTLTMAETVVTAQKDVTLMQEARLRTSITITDSKIDDTANTLKINITNNGNEMVSDLPHMDIFSFNTTNGQGYTHYTYDRYNLGNSGNWSIAGFTNDYIHAGQLDSGVNMTVVVTFYSDSRPDSIQVTTNNGISAIAKAQL